MSRPSFVLSLMNCGTFMSSAICNRTYVLILMIVVMGGGVKGDGQFYPSRGQKTALMAAMASPTIPGTKKIAKMITAVTVLLEGLGRLAPYCQRARKRVIAAILRCIVIFVTLLKRRPGQAPMWLQKNSLVTMHMDILIVVVFVFRINAGDAHEPVPS